MSLRSSSENDLQKFSPKEQLSFIFLQFQRTLILAAIRFYEKLDDKFKTKNKLKLDPSILDLENEMQIRAYLEYCRDLRKRFLVRLMTFIHDCFDRSKSLKALFLVFFLFVRRSFRFLFSQNESLRYQKWIKKNPDFQKAANSASNSFFKSNFTFVKYASEDLNANAFQTQLEQLLRPETKWLMLQTEPGEISKNAIDNICEYLRGTPDFTPDFLMAFGDGDSLSPSGKRESPRFYPRWNLRYFIGENCLRGILIFSSLKLKEFIKNKNFSNLPELLASLAVELKDHEVLHIPKILFHSEQKMPPEQNLLLKYADEILQKKYGAKIVIEDKLPATIVWPLPQVLPKVSIVIPTRDRVDLVKTLVDGLLFSTDYENLEIVIVDNQSSEEKTIAYFEEIKKIPKVKVCLYDFKFNFSAINNFGFKFCTGEILALLNNDLEIIHPGWLKEMLRELLAPDVGIVGAKLYFKNNYVQHAGVVLGSGLSPLHIHGYQHRSADGYLRELKFPHQLLAVTGACMLTKAELFAKLQGFNETDLSVAYNDIDLCLRIIASGQKVVWTPKAELYHLESASRPPDRRPEQIARYRTELEYMRKIWKDFTKQDPYYNPNLTNF